MISSLENIYRNFHSVIEKEVSRFASKYEIIWQNNNTRLLKFSSSSVGGSSLLFIPSLLNRGYILDIMQNYSLIEFLSNQGFNCFLIDFGDPIEAESEYTVQDYYNHKIRKAFEFLISNGIKNVSLIGHCLGGVMAILSSILHKDFVRSLTLISTPWDFSCYRQTALTNKFLIDYLLESKTLISSLVLRAFFQYFAPQSNSINKFASFPELGDHERRDLFIKVERWTIDNMYLSRGFFRECMYEFIVDNKLLKNEFVVNGKKLNMHLISDLSCFFINGKNDAIVPQESSRALLKCFANKEVMVSNSGHIGMITGRNAKEEIWKPLLNWLKLNI